MDYRLRYVGGHVEVYDEEGRFVFSADNHREALEEINSLGKAHSAGEKEAAA